jgi:hypothetical protein
MDIGLLVTTLLSLHEAEHSLRGEGFLMSARCDLTYGAVSTITKVFRSDATLREAHLLIVKAVWVLADENLGGDTCY